MEDGDEADINTNTIDDSSTAIVKNSIEDRMAAPTEGGVVTITTNAAATADESKKSERKRKRERQRRSDLANAFEELSSLVVQIDPDDNNDPPSTSLTDSDGIAMPSSTISTSAASIRELGGMGGGVVGSSSTSASASIKRVPRRKSGAEEADLDGSGMTRLDLINRTTMLLRRLQRDNMDLRRRFDDYKKTGHTGAGGSMMGVGGHSDDMV